MPTATPPAPLIDRAQQKLIELHQRALGEQRHGTVAVELTYNERGAVLMREIVNLTSK